MFETAKAARLRPGDVAKVLNISRVTVSLWFNGHSKPHHLMGDRVVRMLEAVQRAIDSGAFPLPKDLTRRDRAAYIKDVIERHMPETADAVS